MALSRRLLAPIRRCGEACQLAVGHGTPWRAVKLAAVVGTLLTVINQWEAITTDTPMNWLKVVLTYCVPYLVSTYTSVSKDLHLRREAQAVELVVYEENRDAGVRQGWE
ncbi:hypothetical protein CF392_12215 [Tamilnaduibacter salinus]|uniref:Uncharacterized protein n=1 Tax=Tamilnaduibacter salinus TaxID=1484056 RepID=A0A2A2I1L5_9GAMM|nr:hypothetical protein CF392_12215 [Tamilnaduibacter salinus]